VSPTPIQGDRREVADADGWWDCVMEDAQHLVPGPEAAWLDEERAAQAEAHKVAFWDVLHRLAELYGVELVLTPRRSAARWDDRWAPPRLLAATVRFERRGAVKRRRRRPAAIRLDPIAAPDPEDG
jgi:hypothetical protein